MIFDPNIVTENAIIQKITETGYQARHQQQPHVISKTSYTWLKWRLIISLIFIVLYFT